MRLSKILVNLGEGATLARDVGSSGNLRALASMLGPRSAASSCSVARERP